MTYLDPNNIHLDFLILGNECQFQPLRLFRYFDKQAFRLNQRTGART